MNLFCKNYKSDNIVSCISPHLSDISLQMDDIRLPMRMGTMDDISREDEPSSQPDSQSTADTPLDSMSSQGQKAIYAKEAQIQIDYSSLDEDVKEVGAGKLKHADLCGHLIKL